MKLHHTRRIAPLALGAAAVGAAALAATAYAATTLNVSNAGNEFQLTKKLSAKAGPVTLVFRNSGSSSHNIALRGKGMATKVGKTVSNGQTSRVSANLKKGTYTYFCSVPGHEASGMKGTLTVK